MTPHEPNDDIARLLRAAVEDIEPRPGIEAIRARTHQESARVVTRNRFFGAFGAAVATAAAITAVVAGIKTTAGPAIDGPTTPTEQSEAALPTATVAVPVYYAGETPSGLKLYREFHQVPATGGVDGRLQAAVQEAVLTAPMDRDYRSLWNGVSEVRTSHNSDFITLDLVTNDAMSLHDGSGLSVEERRIAIQQLIYTAQAGLGDGRKSVQFLINSDHTDTVLGQAASEPLANDSVLETNSHVQISSPNEGDVITGGRLEFSGAANSFEATVRIQLHRWVGNEVVYDGSAMTEGAYEDKLFSFSGSIDISRLTPGTYMLMVMEDDPSGGAEGSGADSDTRVIKIE